MKMRYTVVAVLAVLVSAQGAVASPLDNYGQGSRGAAMGGAFSALVGDTSASYYNPAGLAGIDELTVSMGYSFADPALEINDRDVNEDVLSGIHIGFAAPTRIFGMKVVSGGSIFVPDKRVARSLTLPFDQPIFILYGSRIQRIETRFPTAVEIRPWLRVGAGMHIMVDTGGGPRFTLVQDTPENEGRRSWGSITATQNVIVFPMAGIQIKPMERLHLGFAFRGEVEVRYEVPLIVTIDPMVLLNPFTGEPLIELDESTIDLYQWIYCFFSPNQYAFGAAYQVTDALTLSAEVTWLQWSRFKHQAPEGATYYYGGIADLIPANPNFPLPDERFRDITVPAVGVEYRPLARPRWDLFLRAGYSYRQTPVMDQTGMLNYVDSNTHIVAAGIGFVIREATRVLPKPISIDFHLQYFHIEDRATIKDDPASDPYGDFISSGRVVNAGCTFTFRF